jgi:hemerythrin superfamily protein
MATRSEKDACDLLDTDHKNVKKMFKAYEELTSSRGKTAAQKKMDLAHQICHELSAHAQVEEEIFYPALRAVLKDTDILAEAEVEHAGAKDLIAQIEARKEELLAEMGAS